MTTVPTVPTVSMIMIMSIHDKFCIFVKEMHDEVNHKRRGDDTLKADVYRHNK